MLLQVSSNSNCNHKRTSFGQKLLATAVFPFCLKLRLISSELKYITVALFQKKKTDTKKNFKKRKRKTDKFD